MGTITETHMERLRLFANRLKMYDREEETIMREAWIIWENDKTYLVLFDMTYFFELPLIFDAWSYYEPADEVQIKGYPKYLGMVGMILKFFGLTPEEFIELFCNTSNPKEMASNIIELCERKGYQEK